MDIEGQPMQSKKTEPEVKERVQKEILTSAEGVPLNGDDLLPIRQVIDLVDERDKHTKPRLN